MIVQSKAVFVIMSVILISATDAAFQYTQLTGQNSNPPIGAYRNRIQHQTTSPSSSHIQQQQEKQQQRQVIEIKSNQIKLSFIAMGNVSLSI